MLSLRYTPNPDLDLPRRFKFEGAGLIELDEVILAYSGTPLEQFIELVQPFIDSNATIASGRKRPPDMPPGCIQVGVVYIFFVRLDPLLHPDKWTPIPTLAPIWVNPSSWAHFGPVERRKLLPDWEQYLNRVLSGPQPRRDQDILGDELGASEGEETSRKYMMRKMLGGVAR